MKVLSFIFSLVFVVLISLSDFSLFFIKPCYSKISSSPTKHGEIMMMNVPVITNSGVGDLEKIIADTDSGIIIHEFGQKTYLKAIQEIKNISTFGIREHGLQIYALSEGVKRYHEVYRLIIG